jgi:arylformamidase
MTPRMLFDISPPVSHALAVWPGDTPPSRELLLDVGRGDSVTLSTLRTTVHAGAHADAPSHYGRQAATIDQRDLEPYLGPCQVVRTSVPRGVRLTPEHVTVPIHAPRVLFATDTYPDPERFNRDFAALDPALVDWLAAQGVRLVGVDTPSVDLFDDARLEAHNRCLAHDIAILEQLVLREVPAGEYELIALPLRLVGFDASPVRAVLRTLPGGDLKATPGLKSRPRGAP